MVTGQVAVAAQVNSDFDTLYTLVNGNIDNSNISDNAGIVDSKLAQISTGGKVAGSAIILLPNIPSNAGILPLANLPTGTAINSVVLLNAIATLPSLTATNLTNLPYVKQLGSGSTLTISSDTITVTDSYHLVDTEGSATLDNLSTIICSKVGQLLVLKIANDNRKVTLVDGTPLRLAGNFTLTNGDDSITLICVSANIFIELCRSDNAS